MKERCGHCNGVVKKNTGVECKADGMVRHNKCHTQHLTEMHDGKLTANIQCLIAYAHCSNEIERIEYK